MSIVQSIKEKREKTEAEIEVDRYLKLSAGATLLAIAGPMFLFPPAGLAGAALAFYTSIPLFKIAGDNIFRKKRIKKIEVLDSISVIATLAGGYYTVTALSSAAYYGAQKLKLKTEYRAKKELAQIFSYQAQSVWIMKNDVEVLVPIETLARGDIVVVNAGETIPVDGTIVQGMASINQHLLTGEFQPVEKGRGDMVFSATIVISGRVLIEVEKRGDETVVSKIGHILQNTSTFTDEVESIGEKIADNSVPYTIALSALALPFAGRRGTTAMLSSDFLDNMRVTAPISMLNFLRIASREGVLIKDGRSLQILPQVDTIIFDKTGTLTLEHPVVGDIHCFNTMDRETLLTLAASAESRQTHPVALAILKKAGEMSLPLTPIDDAHYHVGYGISAKIGDKWVKVGSDRFLEGEDCPIPDSFKSVLEKVMETGCSLIYVSVDGSAVGAIEMHPQVRPEAREVINFFRNRNISIQILSGDHEKPTRILSQNLGIDSYFAQVLPQDKADLIEKLQKEGKTVCFVGDGINDSIALKKASVSISMRGASTIATDSAQIVLMDESLKKLPALFNIAWDFKKNMKNTLYAVSAQNALAAGGVLFLGMGVQAMAGLYIVSMISAAGITMVPALKLKSENL
ncbi:MAG: heavy metal translocating P-type ATPase [Desulfamplus sp.]|nr:heavy metal translocating P-type ATPase [Desulfamplus sp.]